MSLKSPRSFLSLVLWADAVSCLVCGLLQVAFTGTLRAWLGMPGLLLAGSGEFLLFYGVVVAFLATRSSVPSAIIWVLIAGNVSWALACFYLLFGSGLQLTPLGNIYVAAQAFTVAALAQLQFIGMRRGKPLLA